MFDYKEQFKELKSKRNVLTHTWPKNITKEEEESAHYWWTNHECLQYENKDDTEFGILYPYMTLLPKSIGTTIHVVCSICMKGKNVTDYVNWWEFNEYNYKK